MPHQDLQTSFEIFFDVGAYLATYRQHNNSALSLLDMCFYSVLRYEFLVLISAAEFSTRSMKRKKSRDGFVPATYDC
jgi:hypothetical protein